MTRLHQLPQLQETDCLGWMWVDFVSAPRSDTQAYGRGVGSVSSFQSCFLRCMLWYDVRMDALCVRIAAEPRRGLQVPWKWNYRLVSCLTRVCKCILSPLEELEALQTAKPYLSSPRSCFLKQRMPRLPFVCQFGSTETCSLGPSPLRVLLIKGLGTVKGRGGGL